MAGRGRGGGRGRGRGKAFPEHWGVGRDEPAPKQPAAYLPPVDFPPLQYKPLPLRGGLEEQQWLTIKMDFKETISNSPFYVRPISVKKDIDRYSDVYNKISNPTAENEIKIMDESRFPKETRGKKRKLTKKVTTAKSKLKTDNVDIEKTLKDLESRETKEGDEDDDEDAKEHEDDDEEQVVDEDEFEAEIDEGTDYNSNYFDNGEDYGDDGDDKLDDGPTF